MVILCFGDFEDLRVFSFSMVRYWLVGLFFFRFKVIGWEGNKGGRDLEMLIRLKGCFGGRKYRKV